MCACVWFLPPPLRRIPHWFVTVASKTLPDAAVREEGVIEAVLASMERYNVKPNDVGHAHNTLTEDINVFLTLVFVFFLVCSRVCASSGILARGP